MENNFILSRWKIGAEDAASWYQMYSAGFNLRNPFLAADVDEDGDVDDDDLGIISDNYGMTGAIRSDGDANGNGTIDDADLDIAFAQFGLWFNSAA